MSTPRGPGRRPGSPDTRAAILDSARGLFAERGLKGTTIRAVAAGAQVDPALVHHYFGTKDDLFMASLQIPVDPRELLAPVVAQGPDGAAERILRTLLSVWDDPELRLPLLSMVRGIAEPQGQVLLRDGFLEVVIRPIITELAADRPELRMPLIASQLIGLILVRYLVVVEPVASLPVDDIVGIYAPTLQRYLTGDLP